MSKEAEHALLTNFFGGYFHEDWPCDAQTPDGIIAAYSESSTQEEPRALAGAIMSYSGRFKSESELEGKLFSKLGCYYRPSVEALSARTWLENIARQLRLVSKKHGQNSYHGNRPHRGQSGEFVQIDIQDSHLFPDSSAR